MDTEDSQESAPDSENGTVKTIRNRILSGFQWIVDKISYWYLGVSSLLDGGTSSVLVPPNDEENEKLYMLDDFSTSILSVSEIWALVAHPLGVEENEWITTHLSGLFENINTIYAAVVFNCTNENCPEMSAPNSEVYLWLDLEFKLKDSLTLTARKRKAQKLSAPLYIDCSLSFIQKTLKDQKTFPTGLVGFPRSCKEYQSKISLLLFHIIAHIYHRHFATVATLQLQSHLNCSFIHLSVLMESFNLVDEKETTALQDFWKKIKLTYCEIESTDKISD